MAVRLDMKLSRLVGSECAATRERISLELDDRLSDLDRAYMRAHLDGCAACQSFRRSMLKATRLLRADGLEQPGFTIAVPRRRRVPVGALQATAGAAAIALVATLSAGVGSLSQTGKQHRTPATEQRAFVVRNGKFVPAGNRGPARRVTSTRIAL